MKWLFVILIIGAIVYTFRDTAGPILEQLKETTPSVLAGICVMSGIYCLVEALITTVLAKQYNPDFRYQWGIENMFFCSFYRVATLGSGSGVAAIIYLNEHGVDYSKGFGMYMLQYAFHKISIAIYSAIFFFLSWNYMCGHFGAYTWLLLAGYAITMVITLALILFCCSTKFHQLIFAMLDFFNKKGKYDALEHQLREQCADLETASKYLLHKKKMVVGVIGLNLLKLCFWYGMPYLLFAGDKNINLVETMAITALSVMLAAVIPAPAGIGSTEFVFTGLFAGIVLMPVLPFIGDNENNILEIVKRAADSGAKFIYPYFGVTLRHNQREYYYNKLDSIFPDMNYLIKYKSVYGESYECVVPNHEELELLFQEKCNHYGILYRMSDIIREYQTAYDLKQLSLFDFIPE